jgi:DNA-binding SARP family transcriptional activator
VRYQELRDARLVIQENHSIQEWKRVQSESEAARDGGAAAKELLGAEKRHSRLYRVALVIWFFLVMSIGWMAPASASFTKQSAVDPIAKNYQIPITNPTDKHTLPDILNVASATIDTTSPIDPRLDAPRRRIFLTVQMSSGPIERSFGDPLWGNFFSGMTSLPASALRYIAASGRSYAAMRTNPINQASNPNTSNDDGLVDATYYFILPITNRRGTLVISSTRTEGVEYESFVGIASGVLDIGGPTRVPLVFPKKLTVTVPSPTKTPQVPPGVAFGNVFNLFATVLAGLFVGFVFLRRRRTNHDRRPRPVFVVGSAIPKPPMHDFQQQPAPRPQPVTPTVAKVADAVTTLRVNVLGPLTISPVNGLASDPVRAIVAFLAMNTGRLFTLEEIQTAIWPLTDAGTDIKKPAMRNYMVDARKTVGPQHLPTASGRAGYQLCNFTTDWSEFQDLLNEVKKTSKDSAVVLRRRALDLAIGPPFTADTSRYFTWTLTSSVVYKMVDAVTTLAHELGTHYVLAGDLTNAQVVLRQGLEADPASLTLWEDLTDVLLESADQSLLELHWKSANLVLRAEDVDQLRGRSDG